MAETCKAKKSFEKHADHIRYTKYQNRSVAETCKAKKSFEKKLFENITYDPKICYAYVHSKSKSKTKSKVEPLINSSNMPVEDV